MHAKCSPLSPTLSDAAIKDINSLGGPPLPLGVSPQQLRVILENVAASQTQLSNCRIASAIHKRHQR